MKPRSLAMQAFGPFANRGTVDFTRLPEDSLFLIHGPTGAGKSTLFDGICFALYGDTSGGERQPRGNAQPSRRRHGADRSGTGVRTGCPTLPRQAHSRTGTCRPARQGRAGEGTGQGRIARMGRHGVDAVGFPQRRSHCASRRLARLRGRAVPPGHHAAAKPVSRTAGRGLQGARKNPRSLVQHAAMQTTAGTASIRRPRHGSPGDRGQAASRDAVPASGNHHRRGTDTKDGPTRRDPGHAHGRRSEPAACRERRRRSGISRRSAGRQVSGTPACRHCTRQAAGGRGCNGRPAREPGRCPPCPAGAPRPKRIPCCDRTTSATGRAGGEGHRRCCQGPTPLWQRPRPRSLLKKRVHRNARSHPELNRLEGLRAAAARLVEAESVRVAAVKARDDARKLFEKLDRDARGQAEKRKALAASLEKIAPLAAKAEMLKRDIAVQEDRLDSLKKLVEAAKLGEQAKEALASADQAVTKAGEGLDLARKHRDALDLAWRTGQAAVLARHLVDGGPCPVCGSEEHPHPAEDTDAIPADAEIEAAQTAFTSAEAALERSRAARTLAATNVTTQTATFDALRSALGLADGAPLPAIKPATEAIASLREQEKQATAAQKEMDTQKSQCTSIDAAIADIAQKLDAARESSGRASEEASKAEGLAHAHAQAVPGVLARQRCIGVGVGTVRSRIESLERALVACAPPTKRPRQMSQRAKATRTAQNAALRGMCREAGRRPDQLRRSTDRCRVCRRSRV
ncbi:MAG: AAA family ATPase [Sulfuritalea sp.]|nr:AAA family ATPase [Sulfuritalea sp.]